MLAKPSVLRVTVTATTLNVLGLNTRNLREWFAEMKGMARNIVLSTSGATDGGTRQASLNHWGNRLQVLGKFLLQPRIDTVENRAENCGSSGATTWRLTPARTTDSSEEHATDNTSIENGKLRHRA